jgi:hypothetical protein
MWVGTEFSGDTNQTLKDVQFRLYGEMLLRLYSRPRDPYLDACRLIQVKTDLATRLRSMDGFDHRTLQDIHDIIAAWFRFSQDDGGQLRLGESGETYEARITTEWRTPTSLAMEVQVGHPLQGRKMRISAFHSAPQLLKLSQQSSLQ